MEQTDTTGATNSLSTDAEHMVDLRKSQVNLASGTVDEANFYINEVGHLFEARERAILDVLSCVR